MLISKGHRLPFRFSENGLLQRNTHSKPVVVFPDSLKQRVAHRVLHTQIARHLAERKMFYNLCQQFSWPSMSIDIYSVLKASIFDACERTKIRKHATALKLLPTTEPSTYVSIDILGPLVESNNGVTAVLVIADCFLKLTETGP